MFQPTIDTLYYRHNGDRVYQGDILRDVPLVEMRFTDETGSDYEVVEKELPYIVVLAQDCDLEQDFKNRNEIAEKHDKYMESILVCPAYQAESFRTGTHLEKFTLTMEYWDSKRYAIIKDQQNDRFHFLNRYQSFQVPDLVIDFKHYYTIPRDVAYTLMKNNHYLASLRQLFREDLSHRFSFFLSRIGLPMIKCDTETKL
jgi:hypothetical protein